MFRTTVRIAGVWGAFALTNAASAHCDTTRGPVVTAAREALDAGDADLVLHWVRPEDEAAVRSAFDHAASVRALGPEAAELADRYFFETLVRVHRAGEGAPYTGLSESPPEPIIAATDRSLEGGSAAELEQELVAAVRAGLAQRFAAAHAARDFVPGDVPSGRAFVAAYVPLTHWVEGVWVAANGTGEHPAGEHHAAAAGGNEEHPGIDASGGPGSATSDAHESTARNSAPWIVAALLAIVALTEGAFLSMRRRPATG